MKEMKTMKTPVWIPAVLILAVLAAGCINKKKTPAAEECAQVETCFTAIDRYLTDSIGTHYAPAQHCIPFHPYVTVDETNPEDILVWGDFWVLNYEVAGDTLKCVSGGDHPGKMHVKMDADGHFAVTGFEAVGDGSDFLPSAKRIFGERFDDFMAAQGDQEHREKIRAAATAAFVKCHEIPVKLYQDFGWPARPLPEE